MTAITPDLLAAHHITADEYQRILKILGGREPNLTELGIFSVMWSEHCSQIHVSNNYNKNKINKITKCYS